MLRTTSTTPLSETVQHEGTTTAGTTSNRMMIERLKRIHNQIEYNIQMEIHRDDNNSTTPLSETIIQQQEGTTTTTTTTTTTNRTTSNRTMIESLKLMNSELRKPILLVEDLPPTSSSNQGGGNFNNNEKTKTETTTTEEEEEENLVVVSSSSSKDGEEEKTEKHNYDSHDDDVIKVVGGTNRMMIERLKKKTNGSTMQEGTTTSRMIVEKLKKNNGTNKKTSTTSEYDEEKTEYDANDDEEEVITDGGFFENNNTNDNATTHSSSSRHLLHPDTVQGVLYTKPKYNGNKMDEHKVNQMIDSLSPQQLETAACTSYTYWLVQITNNNNAKQSSSSPYKMIDVETARTNMACHEAYRHLIAENKNLKSSMERFHNVLFKRQKHRYDLLRDCFTQINLKALTEEDIQFQKKMRDLIQLELNSQIMIARGHDRSKCPILYKGKRIKEHINENAYQTAYIYSVERCCAIAEILAHDNKEGHLQDQQQDQRITTIVDLGSSSTTTKSGNDASYKVPMNISTNAAQVINYMYPLRLHEKIILDPPAWLMRAYNWGNLLLPKSTMEKVTLLQTKGEGLNEHEVSNILNKSISQDQAMSTYYKGGKLGTEIDLEYYLYELPFFGLYDHDNV